MRKKTFCLTVLTVLLVGLFAMPVFAGTSITVNVNGEPVSFENGYYVSGTAMIPVSDLAEIIGASLEQVSNTQVKLTEDDLPLLLTTGEKTATFGTSKVTLPLEPVIIQGNEINVPLRFTADLFGFKAKWDSKTKTIFLERIETRDGMTALDLLVKSNNATQNVDTYSMSGNMDMVIEVNSGEQGAQTPPVSMKSVITGQIKNQPMEIYIKQVLTPQGEAAATIPETVVETYMTEENMYVKAGEEEWSVISGPFSPEFWKQQREIQNDPLNAAAQLQEMGAGFQFGNDITVDGTEYYVINAFLDLSKAMETFKDQMQQAITSIAGTNAISPQQIESLLENSKIDYRYSVLINKETLVSDIIRFNADLDFAMEVPAQEPGQESQTMNICEKISGEFKIFDLNKPFVAPDVSKAKPFETPETAPQEQL